MRMINDECDGARMGEFSFLLIRWYGDGRKKKKVGWGRESEISNVVQYSYEREREGRREQWDRSTL